MSTETKEKIEETLTMASTTTKRKFSDNDISSLDDNGVEIILVSPSPKKRVKKTYEIPVKKVKKQGRPLDEYKKQLTIYTMDPSDGSNVLTIIPGGYTYHFHTCQYIRLLHGHLSKELGTWIDKVINFTKDVHRDTRGLFVPARSHYIKDYVMNKIVPLKQILDSKDSDTVVHAYNMTALKAFFECDDAQARFIYYLGAATEFQLKFIPQLEDDENSYEIFTLFSHGKSWNFGEK